MPWFIRTWSASPLTRSPACRRKTLPAMARIPIEIITRENMMYR